MTLKWIRMVVGVTSSMNVDAISMLHELSGAYPILDVPNEAKPE